MCTAWLIISAVTWFDTLKYFTANALRYKLHFHIKHGSQLPNTFPPVLLDLALIFSGFHFQFYFYLATCIETFLMTLTDWRSHLQHYRHPSCLPTHVRLHLHLSQPSLKTGHRASLFHTIWFTCFKIQFMWKASSPFNFKESNLLQYFMPHFLRGNNNNG